MSSSFSVQCCRQLGPGHERLATQGAGVGIFRLMISSEPAPASPGRILKAALTGYTCFAAF